MKNATSPNFILKSTSFDGYTISDFTTLTLTQVPTTNILRFVKVSLYDACVLVSLIDLINFSATRNKNL